MFTYVYDSLEFRMKELHDAIKVLRQKPEFDELCFRVYVPGDDINLYRSSLEEEAKNHGYDIYFKPGKVGTTLGMIKYISFEYWS